MNKLSSVLPLSLIVASFLFAGCAAEEAPPEEKGETTSEWSLPDLPDLGGGGGEGLGFQEEIQRQQDAVNDASQSEKGESDALRRILDTMK